MNNLEKLENLEPLTLEELNETNGGLLPLIFTLSNVALGTAVNLAAGGSLVAIISAGFHSGWNAYGGDAQRVYSYSPSGNG